MKRIKDAASISIRINDQLYQKLKIIGIALSEKYHHQITPNDLIRVAAAQVWDIKDIDSIDGAVKLYDDLIKKYPWAL